MHEQENTRVVRAMYDAFKRGDIAAILDRVTEDSTWEVPGPPHVPHAGRYFGRDGVARFFESLARNAEFPVFEAVEYVAQGEKVAALGHYTARARSTGREYTNRFVMVFALRNGKVAEFHEYADTAAEAAAYDTGESKLAGTPGTP